MKIKFTLILSTLLFITVSIVFIAKSQRNEIIENRTSILSLLRIEQFDLKPLSSQYSKNSILLDERDFITKFGNPISIMNEFDEMLQSNLKHLKYNGADVWFQNNELFRIIFTNNNYCFAMSNEKIIKVGDSIDLVAELFPVAWKDQKNPQGQVFLNLSYNNVELDMSLNFGYDINTKTIKSISVSE